MGPTDKPDKTRPADDPREAYEELPLVSAKGSSNRPDQVSPSKGLVKSYGSNHAQPGQG
ncbi:hypothetical protein ASPTUDRAFT_53076 [Aspergillus tubingensis CBS 134.48]|uniref:Uncharacterized protein n=1 Tax=Aspergillus tubingensis (strain CBS 134.48) TaxID=767770 RepID=A0A1L9NQA4_ASPTC|nr:hypothetical protein ASPTUDRAFT_53076 [Aspergillus tubingensis CBS 134.48]